MLLNRWQRPFLKRDQFHVKSSAKKPRSAGSWETFDLIHINRFFRTSKLFPPCPRVAQACGTRSAIKFRSSSATTPSTVKTILLVGVPVSTCSETSCRPDGSPHDPGCQWLAKFLLLSLLRRQKARRWNGHPLAPSKVPSLVPVRVDRQRAAAMEPNLLTVSS